MSRDNPKIKKILKNPVCQGFFKNFGDKNLDITKVPKLRSTGIPAIKFRDENRERKKFQFS